VFNVNVLTEFSLSEEAGKVQEEEALVRKGRVGPRDGPPSRGCQGPAQL